MKVLHVAPSLAVSYGGPAYSVRAYARAARIHGCDVDVIAPAATHDSLVDLSGDARLRTFRVHGRAAFVASPALWAWLRRNGGEYDVVHVHGLFNPVSSVAARICVRRSWALVIRPFGTLSRFTFAHRRSTMKRCYFAVIERRNLQRAGAIHFTTDGERLNAAGFGVGTETHAHVVPPPWTPDTCSRSPSRRHGSTVLLIGRLHPVKAIECLLAAWPVVVGCVPTARLVIAGDGERRYVASLREQARALGTRASASIDFAGFVTGPAKQRLFDDATIVACPSYHENFGVSVLEACANGLLVVLSPEVQLAPFIVEHGLGILSRRDPASLAAALVAALSDAALRARAESGRTLIEQHFDPATVGSRLLAMYDAARVAGTC